VSTGTGPLPATVEERDALAERVAAAVLAVPGVAGPHGGRYNDIATFRPGGRLLGVRIGEGDEPVEVAVVLGTERPIPEVVADLRAEVSRLCGGAAVDVTVGDIALDPARAALLEPPPAPAVAPAAPGRRDR
jgi:hypothetical protein